MGAWSRNLATNEVWWSRELEELFGLDRGGFTRTEAGFFEFVHEDDRAAVRAAVDHAVQHGTDYTVEFRFWHARGEWRWMEGRGRAVYVADGAPLHLYGIGIDVTERKRAELALSDAKLAAESANQLKDQFLATLSHELRTPLNAILGYTRMLQTNAIPPDKRQRAIDVIERNAVAQSQLVEELLDMSRITTGKLRLDPIPLPVVTVLREAIEGVKPAADAKAIILEVDVDPFAGSVRADTTRLQQVFWNLLTNAVKFTHEGGRVTVSLRGSAANVQVVVSDTGEGISPEFLPFAFEPFRQAESRFARTHGGLGLGLAITRQLVELHGGTIEASSPGAGQGATFTVTLPRLRS
jgi:PAS domain S-box-containing protein